MNKSISMIVAIFGILFVFGVVGFIAIGGDDDSENASTETSQREENSDTLPTDSRPADGVEPPTAVEEASLIAVGEYTGSGVATRSFDNDTFLHEVIAQLDPPAEGKFYEGWLVGDELISTGKMTSESGNEWSLVYTSDDDLRNLNSIFITLETAANGLDGIPEDHVLEGLF